VIQTGDSVISETVLKDCSDIKKVVWIENDAQTIIGSTSETVVIHRGGNQLSRRQELLFSDPKRPNRRVNLTLQLSTFNPIICTDHSNKLVQLTYSSNGVDVVCEETGQKQTQKHQLEDGVFDLFAIELVIRILPLQIGYKTQLKAYNHMVSDTVIVTIEVVDLHMIWDGERLVEAWYVPVCIGEQLQSYWISKDTRELLKQSVKLGEGTYFEFIR
jgi:hypothetical protein